MKTDGDMIECSFAELLTLKELLANQGQKIVSVKLMQKGYQVKTVSILETTDLFTDQPNFLPD